MKYNRRYLFMATAALTAFILTGTTSIKAHADDNQAVIVTQQQTASTGSQKDTSVDTIVTNDSQSNSDLSSATNSDGNSNSVDSSSLIVNENNSQSAVEDTNVNTTTAAASAPKNQFVTSANGKISYYDNNGQKVAGR